MDKRTAITMNYQIATLNYPTIESINLLLPLTYLRILELLLLLRQYNKPIKSPYNFLKIAVEENWTPESIPKPINQKVQNIK
ncbi:hypothetical protein [Paenibacillus sp. FSL H7-0331]|uniref:hypothetical protein n=1 Tax=Paenibacillus sp. FSL H7-0331 TaxID=1920421 RepID=UPI00096EF5F8|nr:hypothetical protein [Paenibacillus sp. FSL H7-0331]OMF14521.1 hypothetical protein BK127_17520 [Paenibacillus sp. FSL H7-0331]